MRGIFVFLSPLALAAPVLARLPRVAHLKALDGFTSAGPVLQTGSPLRKPGYLADREAEMAHFPDQFASADGRLHASVVASGFVRGNGKCSIFDGSSVALIADQRGDDHRTQPLDNAGNRIGCGAVVCGEGPLPYPPTTAKAH